MQVNFENKKAEINYGHKLSNDSRVECSISHNLLQLMTLELSVLSLIIYFNYYS